MPTTRVVTSVSTSMRPNVNMLKSNNNLSSFQVEQVREILDRFERKAAYLDDEINELQNRLDDLLNQRWELEDQISQHKKLTSPHRRLPLEILRMIFISSLPEGVNPPMDASQSPLVLGQVCHTWRKLAWETPALWDSVHVEIPDIDRDPSDGPSPVLDAYERSLSQWIARSGELPLSFSFVDDSVPTFMRWPDAREQYSARLLRMLEAQAYRWEHVQLLIPIDLISRNFALSSAHLNLPILESLDIRFTNHLGIPAPPFPIAANVIHPILRSPSLQSLHLPDVSLIRTQYGTIPTNWQNISELHLGGESGYCTNQALFPSVALNILSYFTQLISCRLSLFHTPQPHFFGANDVTLPLLKSLAVRISLSPTPGGGHEDGIASFFSALNLPRLDSFEYISAATSGQLPPFVHLFRRPHHLNTLKIFTQGASRTQLLACLALCPDITELHLSVLASRALLPVLNTPYQGSIPCSKLEHIIVDCDPPMLIEEFAEMCNLQPGGGRVDRSVLFLKKAADQLRRTDLEERIKFIWGRMLCQLATAPAQPGSLPRPLKSVDFRLAERFHEEARTRLGPLMTDGLTVLFRDDYYGMLNLP